ncbi:MAG: topoisomerase IV [Oscillospiraceae bacterium]|jgi:hypothetical protein|nr:topoisomerase IV [Oscillospiraceae bacterium]
MEYLAPILIAIAVVAVGLIVAVVFFLRNKAERSKGTEQVAADLALVRPTSGEELIIPIELLPPTTQIDENSLVEIADHAVVARITQTLPAIAETAARTLATNASNIALQQTVNAVNVAVQNANEIIQGGNIYRAVLSPSAKLVNSRNMEGAVRGFARGTKNIRENANFVPVAAQKANEVAPAAIAKGAKLANVAANVMNVVSLVVGQYYMSIIDSKLEMMTKRISKMSDFQEREFKSRILSVISLVGEISQFSAEILENDSRRKLKLYALESIKATATELLGQVNISISDITKKNPKPDYKEYESAVEELKTLVGFQTVLVAVFGEISKLTYLLEKGSISTEQSYALYKKYRDLSVQTRTLLGEWHNKQVETLRIDLIKERIAKTGFEAIVSIPLGWIDEKHNYKTLGKTIAQEIASQADIAFGSIEQPRDVYADDVEIIIRDGKYYYLPRHQNAEPSEDK